MKMDILAGTREFRKTAAIASAALVLPFLILEMPCFLGVPNCD